MKHLVLLGTGYAHVYLLSTLAAQPMASAQVTLVAPFGRQLRSCMVPGFVAGHYALEECVIPLPTMLANSGVDWLQRRAVDLNVASRTLALDDGSTLGFDMLSVNSEPVQDRQAIEQMMPGARRHALFLCPLEAFCTLWPQVIVLAQSRSLRVAVIGAGAVGIELACAVAHRLRGSSVTLITGDVLVPSNEPAALQLRVSKMLKNRHITVIRDQVCGIEAGEIRLSCGATLACDVPLLALGAHVPAWLQNSGMAFDANGAIVLDEFQRSTSHPDVFATKDVSSHFDRTLAKNLRAVLAGVSPAAHAQKEKTLNLLSCGDLCAIASWGRWSVQGRLIWRLKDHIDRHFLNKCRPA
jgi:NADH dehydrogenase FAD-containing subunit